jgi:serine/threonine protein phosphatase PrpC
MYQSFALTDTGRRSSNEDAYLCRDDIGLWVVADGMGGHDAGELASEMMVNALWNIPGGRDIQQMVDYVTVTTETVNRNLYAKTAKLSAQGALGTTLATLVICGDQGACLWAGDSRIYRMRNGKLQQLTRDHSLVQELVDQGSVHPEQIKNHPESNVITRAIGVDENLELDVVRFNLNSGDSFLLCSDGLTNEINDKELNALFTFAEGEQTVTQLMQLALSRDAKDNTTLIYVTPKQQD